MPVPHHLGEVGTVGIGERGEGTTGEGQGDVALAAQHAADAGRAVAVVAVLVDGVVGGEAEGRLPAGDGDLVATVLRRDAIPAGHPLGIGAEDHLDGQGLGIGRGHRQGQLPVAIGNLAAWTSQRFPGRITGTTGDGSQLIPHPRCPVGGQPEHALINDRLAVVGDRPTQLLADEIDADRDRVIR